MYPVLEIVRLEHSEEGTFGVLLLNKRMFCLTLERPYVGNEKRVSSIPTGQYLCKRVNSPTFGWVFEVIGVPNRSEILFHVGNTIDDSSGCILLGQYLGIVNSKRAILNSRNTISKFMGELEGHNYCTLTVKECY